jgi:hypothetical protein
MTVFTPHKQYFSKVVFPAYKGLLEKVIDVGYSPIKDSKYLGLHITLIYSLETIVGLKQ